MGSPVKSQEKVAQKDRWIYLKETVQSGCVSLGSPQGKSILWGKWKVVIASHSQVLRDHDCVA